MERDRHYKELCKKRDAWQRKPLLREVYRGFYELIDRRLARLAGRPIVELGSGIGKIKEVIPECLCTDVLPDRCLDRVENCYKLSFGSDELSDLVLLDVFHHLRYPGTALREFHRVLAPGGHVVILDPCLSLFALLLYAVLHSEPLGLREPIEWYAPAGWEPDSCDYYAAQGNAHRIFCTKTFSEELGAWESPGVIRLPSITYAVSGGYSKFQFARMGALDLLLRLDRIGGYFPSLFAARVLVVLKKRFEPVTLRAHD